MKNIGKANKLFNRIYFSVGLLVSIIVGGTIGYVIVEEWSVLDSFYQTIITVSTVGFSEVDELSKMGKLFTAFLIITSFGTFAYAVTSITTIIVSGDYRKYLKTYKTLKTIGNLKDHTIVCGFGRVGKKAVDTLKAHNQKFIIIDSSENIENRIEDLDADVLFINGNATEDEVLINAGINEAKSLLTCLPSDADNLFVVLSAKGINPRLKVISRAANFSSEKKLRMAGANNVIMPDSLGGSHMAQLVTTPDVLEFLDQISIQGENEITLEEISFEDIPSDCQHKSLGDLKAQFPVCNIIGYKTNDGNYVINPGDDLPILPKSKLFVLGNPEQIKKLNEVFGITPLKEIK